VATRLHVSFGGQNSTARVQGNEVVLDEAAPLVVTEQDGRCRVDGAGLTADGVAAATGDVVWVTVAGEVFAFTVADHATRQRTSSRDQDALTPPMSATVVRVNVAPGDTVRDGDVLIALEAMKMELPIRAPRDGVVRAVHCRPGELVQPGDVLIELDD
jgi:3-methylcrotonyl-CoA carboxylase alpha subunit